MDLYVCHYQTYRENSVERELREFKSMPLLEEVAFVRSRKDRSRRDYGDIIVNAICQTIPHQKKNYYLVECAYRTPDDARSRQNGMEIFLHKDYIYAIGLGILGGHVDGVRLFFVVGDKTVRLENLEGEPEDFQARREIFSKWYSYSHDLCRNLRKKTQEAYDRVEKAKEEGQLLRFPVACFSVTCEGEPFYIYPHDFLCSIGALSPLFDPLVLKEDLPHFVLPDFCRPLNNRALLGWWLTLIKERTLPNANDLLCHLPPTLEQATQQAQALADFCHYFAIEYYDEYLEHILSSN